MGYRPPKAIGKTIVYSPSESNPTHFLRNKQSDSNSHRPKLTDYHSPLTTYPGFHSIYFLEKRLLSAFIPHRPWPIAYRLKKTDLIPLTAYHLPLTANPVQI